jgi:hypothetical protein
MYFIYIERHTQVFLSVWRYSRSKYYCNSYTYRFGQKLMVIWTFKWGNITLGMYMHVVRAKFSFIIVHICFKIRNSSFYHKYMVICYAQQSCRSSSSRWWTRLSIKVYHIYTRICVKKHTFVRIIDSETRSDYKTEGTSFSTYHSVTVHLELKSVIFHCRGQTQNISHRQKIADVYILTGANF